MKLNKSLIVPALLGAMVLTGCSKDDFRDLNQNPTAVVTPNPGYLFAQCVNEFEPQGYLLYYYNAAMTYSWTQWGVPTSGMNNAITSTTNNGDQGGKSISTLRFVRDIENYRNSLGEEGEKYAAYQAACQVLTIYLGIFDSDMFGDIPYTEACKAAYGGTLTPAYDSMESLYTLWLQELDQCVADFQKGGQIFASSQDVVFNGDLKKWAKFANSLKLRIAVRLLAQKKSDALAVAAAVKSSSAGMITEVQDDVLFNKGLQGGSMSDDYKYHWSNGFLDGTGASQRVVEFMVNNLDPRVRFFYEKNDWNSEIVKAYYERGKEIPAFIEANVNFEVVNGKKVFKGWKGAGEPWVRYYGLPLDYNSQSDPKFAWYYRAGDYKIAKEDGTSEKAYQTWSGFNHMMVIGRGYNPSVPTVPGDVWTQSFQPRPWYGLYLGAAEVNLYLAEFAMLNNNADEAETYYNKALAQSVQEQDKLAGLNEVAFYGTNYGRDCEGKIDLVDGEIETMMSKDAYKFTGSNAEKLEKIYLQQLLNFTLSPNEQFITSRRSGYPAFGSSLLPREEYAQVPVNTIPRRFDTGTPVVTDLMYDVLHEAFQRQGFTTTATGSNGAILHNERVWADKGAPEWGAGSK